MLLKNQPVESAIVPLCFGAFQKHDYDGGYDRPSNPDTDEYAYRRNWNTLYGLFFVTLGNPNLGAHQTTGKYLIEARMLVSQGFHDFCGGFLVSSGGYNLRSINPARNDWRDPRRQNEADRRLARLIPYQFSTLSYAERAKVPDLSDFVALPEGRSYFSAEEIERVIHRSLCFWLCGVMYAAGKRGVLAVDREDGKLRRVLRHASTLTHVPNSVQNRKWELTVAMGDHFDKAPETPVSTIFPRGTLYTGCPLATVVATVSFDEGRTWENVNSGNNVGAMQLFFSAESAHEIYDEEEGEYVTVYPNWEIIEFPDAWNEYHSTVGAVLMWPNYMYNNY